MIKGSSGHYYRALFLRETCKIKHPMCRGKNPTIFRAFCRVRLGFWLLCVDGCVNVCASC